MCCVSGTFAFLRSFVWLSLLGLAVLVLIGPVLAVVGTLLPFALVGLLAWGGYRGVKGLAARLRAGQRLPRLVGRDEKPILAALPAPQQSRGRFSQALWVVAEVCCGALVGGGLAALAGWQQGMGFDLVALGTGIGAVVGFLVG